MSEHQYTHYCRHMRSIGLPVLTREDWEAAKQTIADSEAAEAQSHAASRKLAHAPRKRRAHQRPAGAQNARLPRRNDPETRKRVQRMRAGTMTDAEISDRLRAAYAYHASGGLLTPKELEQWLAHFKASLAQQRAHTDAEIAEILGVPLDVVLACDDGVKRDDNGEVRVEPDHADAVARNNVQDVKRAQKFGRKA